jgi:hypothetical protein
MRFVNANFGDVDQLKIGDNDYLYMSSPKPPTVQDKIFSVLEPVVMVGAGLFAIYMIAKVIKKA